MNEMKLVFIAYYEDLERQDIVFSSTDVEEVIKYIKFQFETDEITPIINLRNHYINFAVRSLAPYSDKVNVDYKFKDLNSVNGYGRNAWLFDK
jgi:hypothetical protein